MSKESMRELTTKLRDMRYKQLSNGLNEPDLSLFVVKQTFVSGVPLKIGFAWPEPRKRV